MLGFVSKKNGIVIIPTLYSILTNSVIQYIKSIGLLQSDDLLIAELPYVETVSDLLSMGLEYDSVLLDEERIIGLMVRRRTSVLYTRAYESQKLIRCCSYTGRLRDKRRCQLRCHLNVGVGQLGDCIRYITSA